MLQEPKKNPLFYFEKKISYILKFIYFPAIPFVIILIFSKIRVTLYELNLISSLHLIFVTYKKIMFLDFYSIILMGHFPNEPLNEPL